RTDGRGRVLAEGTPHHGADAVHVPRSRDEHADDRDVEALAQRPEGGGRSRRGTGVPDRVQDLVGHRAREVVLRGARRLPALELIELTAEPHALEVSAIS